MLRFPLFLAMLMVLLLPGDALAWGPGIHMATASWLLDHLPLLPAALAQVVGAHPAAFRYGSLSADIFIGKGCRVKPGHSHNWSTAHALLDEADTPELRAYAAGYLAHLAADTVAHNHYVPNLLPGTPGSGKFSHVYIEMQADRLVEWDGASYRLFDAMSEADSALLRATDKAALPFRLKKQLFRGSVAVAGRHSFRRSLRIVHRMMPHAADRAYLGMMLDISARAVVDVLRDPYGSAVLDIDPIGSEALDTARTACRCATPLAFLTVDRELRFPLDARLASLPASGVPSGKSAHAA